MTSIQGAIRNLLLADSTITNMVGTRIFPIEMPLDCDLPALTITRISGTVDHNIVRGSPRFQVSCYAEKYETAFDLSEAVFKCLEGYKGVASGRHIKQIVLQSVTDSKEDDTGLFHIPATYKVIHTT